MHIRRVTSEGLAHHSYFVVNGKEAIVIDPRRDVDVYLRLAAEHQVRIRFVLETHRNEDYVIGSPALAAYAGAEVLHSARLEFGYGSAVDDGDEVSIGPLRFRALATPGHTDESLTWTLADTTTADEPLFAFTGDTLFVGETGRVDLYGDRERAGNAARLYESVFEKILPLGDHVVLLPSHGGGSVCGGDIVDRDVSTLGYERRHNPRLQVRDKARFVDERRSGGEVRPRYFERMEVWNQRGTMPLFAHVPTPPALSPGALAERVTAGAVVVDARMPQAFAGGHIPGSYNVWHDGLASYLGIVLRPEQRLVLVLPEQADVERVTRVLLRIGFDHVEGFLRGGFEAWQNEGREVERVGTIDTLALRRRLAKGDDLHVLDVRAPSELDDGTVPGAQHLFVGDLEARLADVPRRRTLVAMCSVGHRGGIAASVLKRHGLDDVLLYLGGYEAWRAQR